MAEKFSQSQTQYDLDTSLSFSDSSPRMASSSKNFPWYLCSKYSDILCLISRGNFLYAMYSSTCLSWNLHFLVLLQISGIWLLFYCRREEIFYVGIWMQPGVGVMNEANDKSNTNIVSRIPTFSLYCLRELSRLWIMLVAWPRMRAKQVAPAIMEIMVSQRSVMFWGGTLP